MAAILGKYQHYGCSVSSPLFPLTAQLRWLYSCRMLAESTKLRMSFMIITAITSINSNVSNDFQ